MKPHVMLQKLIKKLRRNENNIVEIVGTRHAKTSKTCNVTNKADANMEYFFWQDLESRSPRTNEYYQLELWEHSQPECSFFPFVTSSIPINQRSFSYAKVQLQLARLKRRELGWTLMHQLKLIIWATMGVWQFYGTNDLTSTSQTTHRILLTSKWSKNGNLFGD